MEYIEFGKIVNTHALKGEVKVYSYTDNETNILNLKKVYISGKEYQVEHTRYQKGMFYIKLKGIDTVEQAESLVDLVVMREVLEEEKESDAEFFVKDLIGVEVYDDREMLLGVLTQVLVTGANDVYEIKKPNGECFLVPAIKRNVKSIDIKARKMVVTNLEGLIWNLQ